MSFSDIGIIIAIGGAICNAIGLLYLLGWKIGRIELKVDTLWEFQIRRGESEGLSKGVFRKNSPMTIDSKVADLVRPLIAPMRAFYLSLGRAAMTDAQLAFEIEKKFGKELVEKICRPLGIDSGACLVIALKVVKGEFPEEGSQKEERTP